MKTQILTMAAILFLSLNISAKTSTFNNTDGINVSEMANATYVNDEALSIENWMTNDYIWNLASGINSEEVIVDEPLQIEEWMTSSEQWTMNSSKEATHYTLSENEVEEPLTIEGWMTNDESWSL